MRRKISRLLRGLWNLLRQPPLLNHVLNDNALWQRRVDSQHHLALGLPVIPIVDVIDLNEGIELRHTLFLGGASMVTDLALLQGLAASVPDCRYFEIGTWRGESCRNVAEVAAECHSLNLSRGELLEMGEPEAYFSQIGTLLQNTANITQWFGNSRTWDYTLPGKKFDLIFIDGDHHFDSVKSDTENCIRHLAHENTIIVWHDYGMGPEEVRFEILAGILDGIKPEMKKNLFHVSNTQCAVYHPKMSAGRSFLHAPVNVSLLFNTRIKLKPIVQE